MSAPSGAQQQRQSAGGKLPAKHRAGRALIRVLRGAEDPAPDDQGPRLALPDGNNRAEAAEQVGVVRLVRQQELQQARYYRGMLEEQRAVVEEELTRDCELLVRHLADDRNRRRMPRLREAIRLKRREQYQIDCLLESLGARFFWPRPKALPDHRFAIEIHPTRHGYRVRVPDLDLVVTVVSRADAEMSAREHIAVHMGTAISRIAVYVTPAH
ncbi:hypothetical protein [Mycolicibacterium septicum]|uniref:hypothetical protein n=1 Tax=Mycolicibacterium septicum TaxID=98668 RepID=UPI001AF5CA92|nr:hypothetical protein [Mycolicibacterium septicum]QRY53122.1 hypothetical protein JVX95_07230 [Mycolicibacterium septicum]